MKKQPNLAIFMCESCGKHSQADARMAKHLLPWKRKLPINEDGTCKFCGGGSWTIAVAFVQSGLDVGASAMGLAMGAVIGVGYVQTSTSVGITKYFGITAEVVAELNETPAQRMPRITELATEIERARMKQSGARECGTCGILFVAAPGKPWSERGYCSKLCAAQEEGAHAADVTSSPDFAEASSPVVGDAPPSMTIQLECGAGHRFGVPVSFRGMPRKCPECGMKMIVPNQSM